MEYVKSQKDLEGPFLEIGFYSSDLPERSLFTRLVKVLIDQGAQFTGEGYAHVGKNICDAPFASITDSILDLVTVQDLEDFAHYLEDVDVHLLQVCMRNVTGTANNVAEIVTYLSISQEASRVDLHPLAIWTEGWLFSGPSFLLEQHRERARQVGEQVYRQFKTLVNALQPAYAAITVDELLLCPTDLNRDPRSYAFEDFYISRDFIGMQRVSRLEKLFADAYIEPIGDGVYISCYKYFNPEGKSLNARLAGAKSVEVAKMVASLSRWKFACLNSI